MVYLLSLPIVILRTIHVVQHPFPFIPRSVALHISERVYPFMC